MRARAGCFPSASEQAGLLGLGVGAQAYACDDNNTGASGSETTLMIWFSFAAAAEDSMSGRMN